MKKLKTKYSVTNAGKLNERLNTIKSREKKNKNCAKLARGSIGISGYISNLWRFSPSEVVELYRVRWQIELLFKIFKSEYEIDKLKNIKLERIEAHIYATLIKILLLLEITKNLNDKWFFVFLKNRILKVKKEPNQLMIRL